MEKRTNRVARHVLATNRINRKRHEIHAVVGGYFGLLKSRYDVAMVVKHRAKEAGGSYSENKDEAHLSICKNWSLSAFDDQWRLYFCDALGYSHGYRQGDDMKPGIAREMHATLEEFMTRMEEIFPELQELHRPFVEEADEAESGSE